MSENEVTITSTGEDGSTTQIKLKKTGAGSGEIEVKKWDADEDPESDRPDTETTELEDIKASEDGSRVRAAPKGRPTVKVTFTIRCPEEDEEQGGDGDADGDTEDDGEPEKPTITVKVEGTPFGLKDSETTYEISEEDQNKIKDFVKPPRFPQLAAAHFFGLGAVGMLAGGPRLAGPVALRRLGVSLADIAVSLRHNETAWDIQDDALEYVGFDPGIRARLSVAGAGGAPTLSLSVDLPETALDSACLEQLKKYRGERPRGPRGPRRA